MAITIHFSPDEKRPRRSYFKLQNNRLIHILPCSKHVRSTATMFHAGRAAQTNRCQEFRFAVTVRNQLNRIPTAFIGLDKLSPPIKADKASGGRCRGHLRTQLVCSGTV